MQKTRYSVSSRLKRTAVAVLAIVAVTAVFAPQARAGFMLGYGSDFAVLYEGGGKNALQITNLAVTGNIGIGGTTAKATDSGSNEITGAIDFAAKNTSQFSNNVNDVITGGVNYKDSEVTAALATLNALNTSLGKEPGTAIKIGTGTGYTLTINASAGILDANGNRVFDVTKFSTTNVETLTINGDMANDSVVLNFIGLNNVNFNNQVVLNGLGADQVLYNFVGGSNLTGGPTLTINDNGHNNPDNLVWGDFLDPNGTISVTNTNLNGRGFGGGCQVMKIVSYDTIIDPPPPHSNVVPEPSTFALLSLGLAGIAIMRKRMRT